jgi:hypothetical protein
VEPIRESLVCNIKSYSSASQSLKLARYIGLKGKLKSTFFLDSYRIALLRHYVMRRKLVMPRKNAGSMVWPARWFGRLDGGVRYIKLLTMRFEQTTSMATCHKSRHLRTRRTLH